MKAAEKINRVELNKVCQLVNRWVVEEFTKGEEPISKLVYVGKGCTTKTIYKKFTMAIESLDDSISGALPDEVIDFYNECIADEVIPPEKTEPKIPLIEEVVDKIEEETETPEVQETSTEEKIETSTEEKIETPADERHIDDIINEAIEKEDEALKNEPAVKIKRKSATPMTPLIVDNALTIKFKDLQELRRIDLPEDKGDKKAIKKARKEAFTFAKLHDATQGQLDNISKTLNVAGYYISKKRTKK